jgi:2-C-methyl-D-erythritol 4-phosphate cytidylyltransferase
VSAVHALIPAAGRGVRAGGALPKQLREVAGRPLVAWAVARLQAEGVESCTAIQSAGAAGLAASAAATDS